MRLFTWTRRLSCMRFWSAARPRRSRRESAAPVSLVTSRWSLVESSRAFLRLRQFQRASEKALADSEREADALWARCALWEITPRVCEMARVVAPGKPLRTLGALHLATYVLARRRIGDLELLTADDPMRNAAAAV